MAVLTWPLFDFFESSGPLSDDAKADVADDRPENERHSFAFLPNLIKGQTLTSCAQGHNVLVFGDHQGFVHLATEDLQVATFSAYSRRVSHLYQYKDRPILVTIGEEEESPIPVLKAWQIQSLLPEAGPPIALSEEEVEEEDLAEGDIDAAVANSHALPFDSKGEPRPIKRKPRLSNVTPRAKKAPSCIKSIRLAEHVNKAWPVTSFAVCEASAQMAVGLLNGAVLLIKGNVAVDRSIRQRLVHEEPNHLPINAVYFGGDRHLYVITPNQVHLYTLSGKERHDLVHDVGAPSRCVTLATPQHHLVMGTAEGISFFGEEGPLSSYAFTGDKTYLTWYRNYLLVVTRETRPTSAVALVRAPSHQGETYRVTLYDFKNKVLAHQGTYSADVRFVTWAWGTLFLVLQDGTLHSLQEKDLSIKLDLLFAQHLYPMAIHLVKQEEDGAVMPIYQRFGDHLYQQGDFDAAMAQYVETIGFLSPSYVISRFLDPARLKALTTYLYALHKAGAATVDHTTLLLHCYTKSGQTAQLDAFITVFRFTLIAL